MLNEDVHIKLVKLYLRQGNKTSRAVRHLVKLEYGEYFANSCTWYKSTIDTIENLLKTQKSTEHEKSLLLTMAIVLLFRYVKLQLKSFSENHASLTETILK